MTFPAVKGCCFVVFWWGRKETRASGAIWLDEQFTVAHSQWSAHAPLPPFPLSQPLTTASEDRTPCSFSGHGTMGAWCRRRRTNTLHDSVTLSLWLIDNVGVLDNSDKLECHMFHCLSVCRPVFHYKMLNVWARCESLCQRTHSLLNVSVSYLFSPFTGAPAPLEGSSSAYYT